MSVSYAQAAKGSNAAPASDQTPSNVTSPAKTTIMPASSQDQVNGSSYNKEQSADASSGAPVADKAPEQPSEGNEKVSKDPLTPDTPESAAAAAIVADSGPNNATKKGKSKKSKDSKEKDSKDKEVKEEDLKPLKEAPTPSVNIWKQRAEVAKTKTVSPSPLDKTVAESSESHSPVTPQKTAAVQDSAAWPTPNLAGHQQTQQERKPSAPGAAQDDKASLTSANKGKNAWTKMQFVPSAKFETQLPRRSGTGGGRSSGRGARDASSRGGSHRTSESGAGGSTPRTRKSSGNVSSTPPRSTSQPPVNARNFQYTNGTVSEAGSSSPKPNRSEQLKLHSNETRAHGRKQSRSGEKVNTDISDQMSTTSATPEVVQETETAKQELPLRNGVSASESSAAPIQSDQHQHQHHQQGQRRNFYRSEDNHNRPYTRGGRGGGRGMHHNYVDGQMPGANYNVAMANGGRQGYGYTSGYYNGNMQRGQGSHRGRNYQQYPQSSMYPMMGVYDEQYGGMVPTPYNPVMDNYIMMSSVGTQLLYYFSIDNLVKDFFLRRNMDSQGFVPLKLVTSFKRMKMLTTDPEFIKWTLAQLPDIELRIDAEGSEKIRKAKDWEPWVLSMEERDESAKNEGPPPMTKHQQQQLLRQPIQLATPMMTASQQQQSQQPTKQAQHQIPNGTTQTSQLSVGAPAFEASGSPEKQAGNPSS